MSAVGEALDRVVAKAIGERRIVGAVLDVRQGGRVLHQGVYGLADREAGRPMTADAIFRLSSLTKPIVATTILAMEDAGLLSLEDQAAAHVPGFDPRITLHHLLTHTSGLDGADIRSAEEIAAGVNRWRLPGEEIMARLAARPLLFAPGTGWNYGPSIDVLGFIAGKLVGGRPEDAIAQFVTGPLGMVDTRFSVTDPARLAVAYGDAPGGAVRMGDPHSVPSPWGNIVTYDPSRIFDSEAFQSGGGGMAGTAADYVTLLETLRTGGGAVLRPETTSRGLSNQTSQLGQSQGPGWQFSYFGAWLENPSAAKSPAAPGTNRWGGIYGHNWFIDPKNELTVLSMSNTGLEGSDGAYVTEVRNAIYGALG